MTSPDASVEIPDHGPRPDRGHDIILAGDRNMPNSTETRETSGNRTWIFLVAAFIVLATVGILTS
jgi:hypothetical protein